jgi:hypothetical protein
VREVNRRCRSGGALLRAPEEDDALCRASVVCLHVMQPNGSQQPGVGDDVSREDGGACIPAPRLARSACSGWLHVRSQALAREHADDSHQRSGARRRLCTAPLHCCIVFESHRIAACTRVLTPDRAPTAAYACATLPHPPTPPLVHRTSSSHLAPFAHLGTATADDSTTVDHHGFGYGMVGHRPDAQYAPSIPAHVASDGESKH